MAIKRYGFSIDGKIKIIQDLVKPLVTLKDTISRTLYVKSIAERLDVDEYAILEKIRQSSQQKAKQIGTIDQRVRSLDSSSCDLNTHKSFELNKRVRIEQKVIAMMLHCPDIIPEVAKRQTISQIQDKTLITIGRMILDSDPKTDNMVNTIISRLQNDNIQDDQTNIDLTDTDKIKRVVASLAISEEKWDVNGCRRLLTQFEHSVKRSGDDLLKQIKTAEKNNDIEMLKKLLMEKQMKVKRTWQHH
jgi:hypothetical protein